jgi:hypothetical protein
MAIQYPLVNRSFSMVPSPPLRQLLRPLTRLPLLLLLSLLSLLCGIDTVNGFQIFGPAARPFSRRRQLPRTAPMHPGRQNCFISDIIERDIKEHSERGAEAGSAPFQVVTRFPPEPNGHLHLGHAKVRCKTDDVIAYSCRLARLP